MDVRRNPCGQHTVEHFLADRLSGEELTAFEDHLEGCPSCRQDLETMAAEGTWWEEARGYLAGSSLDQGEEAREEAPSPLHGLEHHLAPTDDPHMLGRLGGYDVAGVVGAGGMGVVLKGRDTALNRCVAIKVLAPHLARSTAARQRFAREAKAAAAVVHDNVLAIHAVAEANGLPYLVMPYVRGASLEKRLRQTGALPVVEVLRIGMQIAAGLAAAHAQGLVHRDIKPANILLEEGVERVWITDFGLARAADDASLTRTGVIAGTPEYMSPEQAGGRAVDHRSDLFSLGSVLYTLCAGRPPFRAATALAVLRRVEEERPRPIRESNPEVPDWLARVVDRLLAKDPAGRFRGAAEVAALLEGYLAHLRQPGTVPPPDLPPPPDDGPGAPGAGPGAGVAGRLSPRLGLAALVLLTAAGVGILLGVGGGGGAVPRTAPYREDVYQDLRNLRELSPGFTLVGDDGAQYTRPEPGGLRVTLPANRGGATSVAVQTSAQVSGDFEITATYELLSADAPGRDNHVAGPALWIWGEGRECARIGRFNTRPAGQVYEVHHTNPRPSRVLRVVTGDTSGQVRLVRQGSLLSYQVSDQTAPGGFKELFKTEFGTDDLTNLRLEVNAEEDGCAVDARLIDLRIRSGGQVADLPAAAPPRAGRKGWLAAALILGLVITSSTAAGVWLYRRQGRRAGKTPGPAAAPDEQAEPAAAPSVSFACAGCGKQLRARAELAGKKLHCPGCGEPFVVPGP